jgi:hypothetical protein
MNGEIQQTTWLELARQQSRKAAETRAAFVPPMAWERMEDSPNRRSVRGWRLSPAALWTLLPALIVGGAGGTWAFVHHLREARRPEIAIPKVEPVGENVAPERPAAIERHKNSRTVVPAPPRVEEKQPAPAPVAKARTAARRRKRPRARPRTKKQHQVAKLQGPAPKTRTRGTERITFGTSDAPGEGVIIVPPPAKLKPLWTPKSYKKNGRRNATW